MGTIFNRKSQKSFRKELRNSPTEAESLLWRSLSRKGLLGYKTRRQHGIGAYVLDFYCPALKLAIEVDGFTHESDSARVRDQIRQSDIESLGIHFARLTDDEVLGNPAKAMAKIERYVTEELKNAPPPSPPPGGGGD
jgi:very-short-patch-repair endonuclease